MPQSLESERALLGGLLRDPEELDAIRGRVSRDDFYRPEHGALFELLWVMRDESLPIDPATVAERVLRGGREEEYAGLDYVMGLSSETPATANLFYYAEIVREKARRRRILRTLGELVEETRREESASKDLVDRASSRLMELMDDDKARDWEQVSGVVDAELVRIDHRFKNQQDLSGLTTGFSGLDAKLGGFHPETLVVLAARPGMGKTVLALNMAVAVAKEGRSVGIFSLEMGREELVGRLLSHLGKVDGKRLKTGNLSEAEWDSLGKGAEDVRDLQVFFDDTPGITLADIRARARRLKALQEDLGLLVIDYLQLMQGNPQIKSRQEQVSEISRGLKMLSKDLKVPVLALSQLNREVDKRKEDDRRPRLSDLRESGAIEQDADVILFIYRHAQYLKDPDPIVAREAEVIIAKHRAGETGVVPLVFLGAFARFGDKADDFGAEG